MFGTKKKKQTDPEIPQPPVQQAPQPQKLEEVEEVQETETTEEAIGDTEEVTEEQVLTAIANLSHRVARIEHFLRLDY